jgi:hypothetical protein
MSALGKIALGFAGLFGVMYVFSKGAGDQLLVGDVALVPISKLTPDSIPSDAASQAVLKGLQANPDTKDLDIGISVASITNDAFAGAPVGLFRKDGTAQLAAQPIASSISAKTNEVVGILKRGTPPAATGNTLQTGTF